MSDSMLTLFLKDFRTPREKRRDCIIMWSWIIGVPSILIGIGYLAARLIHG